MRERKKKKNGGNALLMLLMVACGAGMGYLIGSTGILNIPADETPLAFMKNYLWQILLLFLAYYVQIILHEGGHLLAGLMTDYRFSSFRIGSFMLLKTREGYSFRRYSLAGTGGQCLLIPPEKGPDGKYPYRLYHLGGVLNNLITAAMAAGLYFLSRSGNSAHPFFMYLACAGVLCAVTNGLPMRISGIATDGYNVIHIGKEPFALEAMWLQLMINQAQTEGIRLKDMPEEWFRIPENAAKSNEIIATVEVFAENRAMDALNFSEAKEILASLESGEYSVIGLYRNMALCDRITIDLMEHGADADVSGLDSRQLKAFRKSMAKFPSVIRTEYAIRLLKEKDPSGAEKYRKLFDSVAKKYPMPSDIESEREIMACLDSCAERLS